MVIENHERLHLNLLLWKSLSYKHHKKSYLYSLEHGIIPSGLEINKKLAFIPVSNDFTEEWNNILRNTEEKLVNELLPESDNVIDNLQINIKKGEKISMANDIEESFKNLEEKHQD